MPLLMCTTVPPGKIQRATGPPGAVGKDAAVPDPVTYGAVNHQAPDRREKDHRAEFHSLREGAANQGWSDDEKHALE